MNSKLIFLILLPIFLLSKNNEIEVVNFEELSPYLTKNNDTTYVINFWATWCGPCVKELPYFEEISKKYSNKKVKVILVSLDFFKNYKERLIPFIEKHKIKSKVILLNDPDSNSWIEKVDKNWSGALPATIIYKKNNKSFTEGSFTLNQLDSTINKIMNN